MARRRREEKGVKNVRQKIWNMKAEKQDLTSLFIGKKVENTKKVYRF